MKEAKKITNLLLKNKKKSKELIEKEKAKRWIFYTEIAKNS